MMHDEPSTGDIPLGDVVRLQDVLSRDAVTSVSESFFALFDLPVRVISHGGDVLADVDRDQPLCTYLNTLPDGARQCAAVLSTVRDLEPGNVTVVHPCFTGAVYRVVPISHQGRTVGRFIVGPYLPFEVNGPPASLTSIEGAIDPSTVHGHYQRMPRVRDEVAEQLCDHLKRVFELLVFSGHRAQLASTMQVTNVADNYRELAEKNEALEESFEELKQLDTLKSTFLATVSHELRTPLTSIIGYTEMLESGAAGSLNPEQTGFLRTIRGKADELLGLIGSLLDLGQLEAKTLELACEPVDARALLSAIASTIVPAANRRNITLDVEVASGTPKVWGDAVRLRQILLNLADNAVKFTDEGGTVALSAASGALDREAPSGLGASLFVNRQPAVVFEVRDTGKGMRESELARIFDAFYQIDGSTTREHGGAGLGLSIVKQLVDAHEGKIEVTSTAGEGTAFVVTLPAADDDA